MENDFKIPVYKITTTVSSNGMIVLPIDFKDLFNQTIEIVVLQKKEIPNYKKIKIPTYKCNGKIKDFSREDIYEPRL